jgi:hypothetical protein
MQLISQLLIATWFTFFSTGKNIANETSEYHIHHSQSKITSILFVGNSLIYTNDLPSLVKQKAKDKGFNITIESLAFPDYALEDHWIDGELQKLIKEKKFDFVVVQQGPSSQDEGREMLLDYGARIKALCKKSRSELAFFMVWPARSNFHMFDGVIKNYTDAADLTSSILCPVGTAWKKYMTETGDYSYYGTDMFHPSEKGSIVAAEVIVESLFK